MGKLKCEVLYSSPSGLNYCSSKYEYRFSCGFVAVTPCDSYSGENYREMYEYLEKLHEKFHKTFYGHE